MSTTNCDLVRELCMSLPTGDFKTAGRFLHDDVYFHFQPWKLMRGRETVCEFLRPFVDGTHCNMTSMKILAQLSEGPLVMNAREERWQRGDIRATVEVAGLFEIEDGVITRWVDYWDLATFKPIMDDIAGMEGLLAQGGPVPG